MSKVSPSGISAIWLAFILRETIDFFQLQIWSLIFCSTLLAIEKFSKFNSQNKLMGSSLIRLLSSFKYFNAFKARICIGNSLKRLFERSKLMRDSMFDPILSISRLNSIFSKFLPFRLTAKLVSLKFPILALDSRRLTEFYNYSAGIFGLFLKLFI